MPEGFSCAQPDMSMPLPGAVVSWPDKPFLPPLKKPVGLLADKWDAPAANSSSCRRSKLTPIRVFDGTNPQPTVF